MLPKRHWLSHMILTFRERLGLTVKAFSELSGIPLQTLRQIENEYAPVNEKHWKRLDELFNNAHLIQRKLINENRAFVNIRLFNDEYLITWNNQMDEYANTDLYNLITMCCGLAAWQSGMAKVLKTKQSQEAIERIRKSRVLKVSYEGN